MRLKATEMSFVDQELSNGVFNSTVRLPQKKLRSQLTKRTVGNMRVTLIQLIEVDATTVYENFGVASVRPKLFNEGSKANWT